MKTNFKKSAALKRHTGRLPKGDKVKKFDVKRSGFKRPHKAGVFVERKIVKKKSSTDEDRVESGKFIEKPMNGASSEEEAEVVHRESTTYDDLLKRLGSRNESVANAFRRRQREEHGESETDEEGLDSQSDADENDDDLESLSEADERDDGDNNESPRSHTIANAPKGTGICSSMKLREDMEQDDALFDTDEESDSVLNDQPLSEACMTTSHINYKLSSREVDELLKTKWSYTWKMPALNMKNCNWRGTGECCIKDLDMTSYYSLKTKLYKNWMEIFKASGSSEFHQSKQKMFFSLCNSYCDIMHHNKKPFYLKGLEEDSNIMDGYLIHSLNHVLRSRDLMSKNDRKLAKNQENVEGKDLNAEAYLDRGFTRPKVLILLPLAGIARRVIKKLIQLTPPKLKDKVENIQRFYEEFGSGITKDKDDHNDSENTKTKMSTKPSDFEALLGRDNNNDHFMIGVKFTKRGIKLYGDFYTSDILVASPLGLITKIGEAEVNKEKDVDYLSSIEILIIDHADVMLMQNWSHVKAVVEQLNQLPSKQRGTDIMRIRPWYLDGQARFYRQTIILSSHINPDFNALFHQHCFNYQGKVKLECKYRGVLPKILTQVQQIYERFDTESMTGADDSRLEYFSKKVFPKIKDSVQHGVMIFVSSYFEFVRLRNYLKSQAASFCLFGEYIKPNDISHVRGQFFRGEKRIMLYTERSHFYYRYKIRGVKNLLIYSLPERKEFYPEIVNFLEPSADMSCTILFSRLDYLRLERIVGSTAAKRMVDSDKGVFVFA
ncbi:protein NUCLEOLAR FACTOR 1 isoform X2 [Primulina huaijiensis]|uniref:protein NUCLEOLAR FACTOR 1 isoform X2 n=1 Tax=Primulina huaijiensis TaxID=1492673 RepID=UPI003CC7915D